MASQVTVISQSLHRAVVKVTATTTLNEVLLAACQKLSLNAAEYGLRSSNTGKNIDLSSPFRLSGLVNGAKLDLVQSSKSPSVVSIALEVVEDVTQPGDGSGGPTTIEKKSRRITSKFPTTVTIWQLLRQFEQQTQENYTARGLAVTTAAGVGGSIASPGTSATGRLFYEEPTLNIVGREIHDFAELQESLSHFGIHRGSHLIRLSFGVTGEPLEDALTRMTDYFGDDITFKTNVGSSSLEPEVLPPSMVAEDLPEAGVEIPIPPSPSHRERQQIGDESSAAGQPVDEATPAVLAPPSGAAPRVAPSSLPIKVFAPVSLQNRPEIRNDDGDDVVDDAREHEPSLAQFRNYKRQLEEAGKPVRALSDKELAEKEEERQEKLAHIYKVTVRIHMPDEYLVETIVSQSTTAQDLYSLVESTLQDRPTAFKLLGPFGPTARGILADDSLRLILDHKVKGSIVVHVLLHELDGSIPHNGLRSELKQSAQEMIIADYEKLAVVDEEDPQDLAAVAQPHSKRTKLENTLQKFLRKPGSKR